VRFPLARIVWSGLRAQAGRLLLTALAIAGGSGFLSGTFVYADTATAAFYDELARAARGVDVVVMPPRGEDLTRIDPALLARLKGLPELSEVDGRQEEVFGLLDQHGRLISNYGQAGHAISLPGSAGLAGFDIVAGRMPAAPGEVAVDKGSAGQHGLALDGPAIFATDDGQRHELKIVGLLDYGLDLGISGLSVAALHPSDMDRLVHPAGAVKVVARAADPAAAKAAIEAVVPPGFQVMTGDQWRYDLAVDAGKYVDGFHQVLFGFSLIALAVAVFVIYNTFTILTARRSRELALWRCLGAGKNQVRVLVIAEAAGLGVAGAAMGFLVSLAIGWGLVVGRGATGGTSVPDHALVLGLRPILLSAGTAILTSVIAALIPAWRAGRIAPLTALQTAPLLESKPAGRHALLRVAGALGLMLVGAWLMRRGIPWGFDGLPWVFGGAVVLFGGLILATPLVIGRITVLVGWLPAKVFGPSGKLALGQARHQPRRAAATTSALMVGVGVLATVSVLLATASEQSRKELGENFAADFQLTSVDVKMGNGKATVPPALAETLTRDARFAAVTGMRGDLGIVNNSGIYLWTAQEFAGPLKPEVLHGSLDTLGNGNVAVDLAYAEERGTGLGSVLEIDSNSYTVVAIYDDAPSSAEVLLSWADYANLRGPSDPEEIIVALADGVTAAQGQEAIDTLLASYPLVEVSGKAQARAELTETFDRLLGIFTALLGVSLLIAIFGIGNTLALSVWERSRESATLRALGLSRAGLRSMLLFEAVLMALVGGGAGLIFGGAVGYVASMGLIQYYGHGSPVLPFGQFAGYLAAGALAAAIAALLPARAAARAPLTKALAAD
jgi:putative ABC transport system permease protein